MRHRLNYAKTGRLRWLSHLELARVLRRAIRRSGLAPAYTQGYHPHERMSFSPPTSVGMESFDEYLDVTLENDIGAREVAEALRKTLPAEIVIKDCRLLAPGERSIGKAVKACVYEFDCSAWRVEGQNLAETVKALSKLIVLEASSKRGTRRIELPGKASFNLLRREIVGKKKFRATLHPEIGPALIVRRLADSMATRPEAARITRLKMILDGPEVARDEVHERAR